MDASRKGFRISLSPARRVVCEIMHHARKVPSLPQTRACNLAAVAAARQARSPSLSWMAVMLKAFGLAAMRVPQLRQAYIPFPWPHLYQHPCTEAAFLVHREWYGEDIVLGSHIRAPEGQSLAAIDARLRWLQSADVMDVPHFRKWLLAGRMPWFIRRLFFWASLNLSGFWRAKRLGTCVVSSVGSLGSEQLHPITPLTSYLSIGPITPDGDTVLNLIYDHRVMDARTVALALNEIVAALNAEILAELQVDATGKADAASCCQGLRIRRSTSSNVPWTSKARIAAGTAPSRIQ